MSNLCKVSALPHLFHLHHCGLSHTSANELDSQCTVYATRTGCPLCKQQKVLCWLEEKRLLKTKLHKLCFVHARNYECCWSAQKHALGLRRVNLLHLMANSIFVTSSGLVWRCLDLVLRRILEETDVILESMPLLSHGSGAHVGLLRSIDTLPSQAMVNTTIGCLQLSSRACQLLSPLEQLRAHSPHAVDLRRELPVGVLCLRGTFLRHHMLRSYVLHLRRPVIRRSQLSHVLLIWHRVGIKGVANPIAFF
mmetsp:Transcript_83868/g.145685  ORF Transcript_83868/g.145685 Transcript_83868/m.145685 type:complete len:251 (-) Transcript_83868:400-1152(-)